MGAGVDWQLLHGKKHLKLFIGGRMTIVLPSDAKQKGGCRIQNSHAAVRRRIRELQQQ